ncbi:TlyA family RNA methyltransferase [Pelagibacteraceae bacterium]|nr:TlyA family RNA methyltransferase [Pelagibacteraceae bacterium]
MKKSPKLRLDQLLVNNNLAISKSRAQSMIMAGQVSVNGKTITKSGNSFNIETKIIIKQLHPQWVSRGALKLLKAIEYFNINIKNKICLDIGSSTGGFSEVLLKKSAKKIYSIDVGTNQLHEKLRNEKKIVSIENFNAKYLNSSIIPDKIDVVVCDVSFISLKKVILPSLCLLSNSAEIIALIKPQFETKKINLKKGIVRDEKIHKEVCANIEKWFVEKCNVKVIGLIPSPITGPKGNTEFLIYSLFNKP